MTITNKWLDYLQNGRKLSPRVIQQAKLFEHDGWLAIPVFDEAGDVAFHKYRRAPWMLESYPKYKYETGSTVSLYGVETLADATDVFICEGELDALTLRSLGFTAVSTTGGASTFREEWAPHFEGKNVYIWYDNDDAGIKGAIKVAFILKEFRFCWTPSAWGKDVSDLNIHHGKERVIELIDKSVKFEVPDLTKDTVVRKYRSELGQFASTLSHGSMPAIFTRQMAAELSSYLTQRPKRRSAQPHDQSLESAKQYPISDLLPVTHGFAKYCPFHNPGQQRENSPSFKVYPNNTAYCFGACQRAYDSIDIYRQLHNIPDTKEGFKEALKRMTS